MIDINRKTILLVEDEEVFAVALTKHLERQNHKIIYASNGEKAIELVCIKKVPVDLILMDIDLGEGIDGIETAERILNQYHIPLLFLSSHIEKEIIEKTEKIYSYGYIFKNSGFTVLDATIKAAFRLFNSSSITAPKRIEEFPFNDDKFRLFVETINDVIFMIDIEGRIKYVSPVIEQLLGYKPDEITGRMFPEFIYPEDLPGLMESFEHTMSGNIEPYEYRIYHRNGELHLVRTSSGLSYSNGVVTGIIGVMVDLTERLHAEEELRKSEEKYRSIFENTQDCYYEASFNGIILEVSPSIELVSNGQYHRDDLIGKSMYDFYLNAEERASLLAVLLEKKSVTDFEVTLKNRDGSVTPCAISSKISYDSQGNPEKIIGSMRNISDRKLAEKMIQDLLQEKELILKEVHHRVKNNMYTIFILLTNQADAQKNPDTRNILFDAAGRVQSMGLLYDKLYISEIKNSVSIKDYLPALIDQIVGIFHVNSTIRMKTDIDEIILSADTLSCIGIIINELITNAIKYAFTPDKEGEISVNISKIENRVFIIFKDNGKGIPESVTFENSTGFGMQLVKMLVKQIKGSIAIERDHGTKFIIEFNIL